ncbi:MAG: ABC transporter ATP-binding protein [Candidatus Omnitrophica bacterium]|nr:ABC transporter ATP-binding protein [Candidatus Omnitrophota bacterium]
MSAIEFYSVWEKYRIKFINTGKVSWEEIWALEDINFRVEKGEVIGVIGQNGAGKTTLLKLIAGMLIPDKGKINVDGKVSVLMELGGGFNPEFTGRENIKFNASMYGLDEEILEQRIQKIIEFADIGKFINAPIKYYSQGMYMRLAFALAIFVEPDILLIDDILAVGDEEAQQKCIKKIFELKEAGKTIILVSHDMNMVSKLCNRVILLEKGRIVQEELPTKIIPYYLETVGDKKGIAVLKKEKLRLVFNNGRIELSYNESLLTKGIGGYVAFLNPSINSWLSSSNLNWRVKNFSPDTIVAEGWSQDEAISQIWTIQLKEDFLQWKVEIKENIKEPHIDLLLIPQYKKWLTSEKEGVFPSFAHKSNWQDLGLNDRYESILGVTQEEEIQSLPSMILGIEEKDSQLRFFNTGYEQEARVIQVHPSNSNFISIDIKVFSEKDKFKDYIKDIREKFLLKQKAQQEKLYTQHMISSGNLRLFADLETKSLRLYFKNNEITKAGGLHSSFAFDVSKQSFWLHLKDAQWQIRKISEKKMVLVLYYEFIPLSQIWTLFYEDNNTLKVRIEAEIRKPIFFTHQYLRLELQDRYKNWITAYEQGDFLVDQYIDNIGAMKYRDKKVSKILLKPADNDNFPKLFFGASSSERRIMGIYKRIESNEEVICIDSFLIIPKKEGLIEPGRYTYFDGKIILGKEVILEEKPDLKEIIEFKKDDLRFIFDRGKGKIFWRQRELTAGLGVYTSVRFLGFWYDSYQAAWQVNQKEDNKIVVLGHWPCVPISQLWQIELIGKNLLSWYVAMEIYEEVSLIEQANLMLSCEYRRWIIPGFIQGEFLDDYSQDHGISPFRFWYGKSNEVVAMVKGLPKVVFKAEQHDKNMRAIVENAESLYKARRLQYQKSNSNKLLPGKYPYFKGVIEIVPED